MPSEGIFDNRSSMFDPKSDLSPNPPHTRGEERAVKGYPQTKAPVSRELMCVADADGKPKVAIIENKRRTESFRDPTPAELEILEKNGKVVALGDATAPPNAQPLPAPTNGVTIPKGAIAVAAGLFVTGVAAWWLLRKKDEDDDDVLDVEA